MGMNVNFDSRTVTDEVEFWLHLSEAFFESFKIKKDPGPSWFLLNEVLRDTRPITVGDAMDALTAAGVVRSKAAYDVTKYAKHLCSLELLDTSKLDLSKHVFTVDTLLPVGPRAEKAIDRYASRVLELVFDRQTANETLAKHSSRAVMNGIYDYMRDSYIPIWEKFLNNLAQVAVQKTKGRQTSVFGYLRGNTEVFVLLHRLWEAHLIDEIGDGFTLSELCDLHSRIRVSAQAAIQKCIERLCDFKILDVDQAGLLKLHQDNFPVFERYIPNFVTSRQLLKGHLESRFFENYKVSAG
jgi:hypothetical protein